ncbi:hypothetical protein MG293_016847 [Ovis ammon polii]|uniref:Uncharacterized protein n=1 Tax=Ovis ammon polii TaxID=230172 RepID=A0AAD4TTU0_OVIAM|nr:hypothetical protein MG293_016847 [Ovis ammon polii]
MQREEAVGGPEGGNTTGAEEPKLKLGVSAAGSEDVQEEAGNYGTNKFESGSPKRVYDGADYSYITPGVTNSLGGFTLLMCPPNCVLFHWEAIPRFATMACKPASPISDALCDPGQAELTALTLCPFDSSEEPPVCRRTPEIGMLHEAWRLERHLIGSSQKHRGVPATQDTDIFSDDE